MSASSSKGTRTCVACSAQAGKAELKRIVRTKDGAVLYDRSGRMPGRGAYVCSEECLKSALASNRLQRSLKVTMSKEEADRIVGQVTEAADSYRVG